MEPNQEHALIPHPSHELVATQTVRSRILAGIVEDSLALAKEVLGKNIDFGSLVQEAGRLKDYVAGNEMAPNNIRAFQLFFRAAEGGHAEGQYCVSGCYGYGKGVEKDEKLEIEWLRMSAESGWPIAQNHLGDRYTEGMSVPQSYSEAAMWYRKAADQGLWKAQIKLSKCYDQGQGVPQDSAEAFKLLRRAAESRGDEIRRELAVRYQTGNGVGVDLPQAYAWFRLAAYGVAESVAIPKSWKNAPEHTREFIMASVFERDDRETEVRAAAIEAEAAAVAAAMSPAMWEVAQRLDSELRGKYSAKRSRRERR